MISLIHAHPHPGRSRANRAMLAGVTDLPGIQVRDLYALYPDFSIDVQAEQRSLLESRAIIVQHPIYWYSMPALLKLWIDDVLAYGWAYGLGAGEGGGRLQGKPFLWAVTAGGGGGDYRPGGSHQRSFEHYVWPMLQTARYCGMQWQEPFVLFDAQRLAAAELAARVAAYRGAVQRLIDGVR